MGISPSHPEHDEKRLIDFPSEIMEIWLAPADLSMSCLQKLLIFFSVKSESSS
jgi:hypothetical protein